MRVFPVPAFEDNYIWVACGEAGQALAVDPGEAPPLEEALGREGLSLAGVAITHHHWDHVGGLEALSRRHGIPSWGPAREQGAWQRPVGEGDRVEVPGLAPWRVLEVPGHTAGHVAYLAPDPEHPEGGWLFCGDTLFAGGCGRLLGGTAAQLHASLERLAALPEGTRVCCAHEYTEANLRFALEVEPGNEALRRRLEEVRALRRAGRPTLPSTIGLERRTNPFLRCREPAVRAAAEARAGRPLATPLEVFTVLRVWKDSWRG
ncbi:MAG: hydroxyacylglutathione hydrolase [Gammaproteobacteria bacterium]|nr:MAG: hydroxyacylglutathione hydrolase [Gammaproteobacteria bacterium]